MIQTHQRNHQQLQGSLEGLLGKVLSDVSTCGSRAECGGPYQLTHGRASVLLGNYSAVSTNRWRTKGGLSLLEPVRVA